ncbi:dihydropteroate synthase [Croceicoccus mobilis]|uniref:dihydropteroate synthase n=1 Tax=Croceicoccus mobilis TaxID=1703339 RepID=A0A916YZN2_9SPHN|nr:dihydropteroate synthase [Croceicoccus mobilis]GGD67495.1 dihydropteroate synthase [Croceicoccus mobilis]
MSKLYLQPLGFAPSPQSFDDGGDPPDVIRLAGTMCYVSHIALIIRSGARVTKREIIRPSQIASVLASLPDDLAADGEEQYSNLRKAHIPLDLGQRTIRLDQPQVMGILNVTPDSFSDGGSNTDVETAVGHGVDMLEAGAAIIDVGGESTRPGAKPVWEGDEIARVVPVVERLARGGAAVSVDTRNGTTMSEVLAAGATIINDVSALRHDPRSAEIVANAGAAVILMHAPGKGEDLHADASYDNVVFDVFDHLRERRDAALAAGIAREKIILDPGIGFGKTVAENLALIENLPLLHALGQPILFAASRKRFIGALSNEAPADKRMGGSLAVAVKAMDAGAQMIRAHDAAETVQAMHVWRGMRDAALTDFSQLAS